MQLVIVNGTVVDHGPSAPSTFVREVHARFPEADVERGLHLFLSGTNVIIGNVLAATV